MSHRFGFSEGGEGSYLYYPDPPHQCQPPTKYVRAGAIWECGGCRQVYLFRLSRLRADAGMWRPIGGKKLLKIMNRLAKEGKIST